MEQPCTPSAAGTERGRVERKEERGYQCLRLPLDLAVRHGGVMAEVPQSLVAHGRVHSLALLRVVGVALLALHAAALLVLLAALVHHPALAPRLRAKPPQGAGLGAVHPGVLPLLQGVQGQEVGPPGVHARLQGLEGRAPGVVPLLEGLQGEVG